MRVVLEGLAVAAFLGVVFIGAPLLGMWLSTFNW